MKVTRIVFSPTGGTKQVADAITSAWDSHVNEIDLTNINIDFSALTFTEDEICVIAVPSYGGRVPALAAERIGKIKGSQAQCVIVCVYGNRAYEDTLVELNDLAARSGFQVIAAVAAVAEHSIMRQYAAGRPDQQDREELYSFAGKIIEKASHGDVVHASLLSIPGNRPYKKAGGAGLVPKAGNSCVNCGLCAEKCPAQAINQQNLKTADSKKCISCMRCVTQCPKSARKVNGVMVSVASLVMKKACLERKGNQLYL